MSDDRIRMCALPDSLTTEEVGARWGKRQLLWCPTAPLPGLADEQWLAALAEAWGYWQAVCGLTFARTDAASRADVLHGVGPIDGSGRTLAWSELPNGADTRLKQRYDSGERWAFGAVAGNQIDIVAVACHEIGHCLGLGHDNAGGSALMDPYYSPRLRQPQPRDVQRIQQLYGPPTATPPPPQPPPTARLTGDEAMAQVAALVARWRS